MKSCGCFKKVLWKTFAACNVAKTIVLKCCKQEWNRRLRSLASSEFKNHPNVLTQMVNGDFDLEEETILYAIIEERKGLDMPLQYLAEAVRDIKSGQIVKLRLQSYCLLPVFGKYSRQHGAAQLQPCCLQ